MKIEMRMIAISIVITLLLQSGCKDNGVGPIGGEKFTNFEGKLPLQMALADPYLYVCAASDGVWRRDIRSMTPWEFLGLRDTSLGRYSNVGALDIDVLGDTVLIAYNGAAPHVVLDSTVGIWHSTDKGSTWSRFDRGIPETIDFRVEGNLITDVKRSPHVPTNVVAVFQDVLYKSTNSGYDWVLTQGRRGMILNWGKVKWNPNRAGEVWNFGETAIFSPFLIRLSNFGSTRDLEVDFTALGFPSDGRVFDLAFDRRNVNIVYAATSNGVIKTTDGGYTWLTNVIKLPNNESVYEIASHPLLDSVLYLAGSKGMYVTRDGGQTAELIGKVERGFIESFALDIQGNQLFVGTARDGIYALNLRSVNK